MIAACIVTLKSRRSTIILRNADAAPAPIPSLLKETASAFDGVSVVEVGVGVCRLLTLNELSVDYLIGLVANHRKNGSRVFFFNSQFFEAFLHVSHDP